MKYCLRVLVCVFFLAFSNGVHAQLFNYVRIGDVDGFGFGGASGNGPTGNPYVNDLGGNPDRNNNGILDNGDMLPDLNEDGSVALTSGDDFDNRNGEGISFSDPSVVTDNGISGVEYTDISLSRSYDNSSSLGNVWNHNTGTQGSGGSFPDGDSWTLPNQPGFVFDFLIPDSSISTAQDIFFNLVFADYDVTPANIKLTFNGGGTRTLGVSRQGGGEDGLVQSAFVKMNFSDVFTAIGSDFRGFLQVDFQAPNEPYTAFDYVELSTEQIAIPEPSTVGFFTLAGLGAFLLYRRRRPGNAGI